MLPVQPRAARQSPADSGAAGLVHYTYHTKKSPLFQGKTSFPIKFHANYHMLRPPRSGPQDGAVRVGVGFFSVLSFFMFFLFFQKKKRKNQRKETLSGRRMSVPHRAALPLHPLPVFPCGAFQRKAPFMFFLFFQEKKRKNQRKETLSGRGMNVFHGAVLPHLAFSVFSLRGFSKKSPAKYFLRGNQVPLTGGRSGIAGADS